jgi:CubicO group peptidase (beta-lactamase class C family)
MLLLASALLNGSNFTVLTNEAPMDYWPTDDWITKNPEDVQMNSTILGKFREYANKSLLGLNGLIIIKSGYLVFEEYFKDWDSLSPHQLYSTTKSVTSALVGIAVDQGLFSVDDPVLNFFSEYSFDNIDSRKLNMTVEHLLNMQSGLDWDEWTYDYYNPNNHYNQMLSSPDWVQYILDKPMATDPGSTFVYCGGASHLLQAIIDRTASLSTLDFAKQFLFDPLGITPGLWESSPNYVVCGAHDLHLTPRDMAKFGYLFMNNGSWDGKQLISKNWILNSTRVKPIQVSTNYGNPISYGYQWWVQNETFDYYLYYTSGLYGQRIHCFPDLDLIFVTTSEISYDWNFLIKNYVILSITEFDSTIASTQDYTTTRVESTSRSTKSISETSLELIFSLVGVLVILRYRKISKY